MSRMVGRTSIPPACRASTSSTIWNVCALLVDRARCAGTSPQAIVTKWQFERNVVKEMICETRGEADAGTTARVANVQTD